ncbi:peptidase S10 family protein [Cavenderia fasciculata]|uniref:Carboxypeptidase n=1 Tax=Cavenderia fasciculata TaxID=261658 RepID=F4Q138_CACFS|nr:peptidase S10 family protein [Cavenderia fasciculata]EGG18539.1 peptidase S10 family protein [Cavenderia fasciculata]|eukprot:XP_004366443.1 peptidase S10 family protein [Cavenderia fasciculata]
MKVTQLILSIIVCILLLNVGLGESKKYFKMGGNELKDFKPVKEAPNQGKWEPRTKEDIIKKVPQWNERLARLRQQVGPANQSSFLVTDLPGLDPSTDIVHYAGLININETSNGNIFFWFIQANVSNPETAPVAIWINGGPGCSSMDGLFLENGPFRLSPNDTESANFTVSINPSSWHNVANILYIDEPVGTGLSYVDDDSGLAASDEELETDFYTFLQSWYNVFDNFTGNDLYISGESYAGHYIPHYSNFILTMNDQIQNNSLNGTIINLKGVAIGNGWTHPVVQYESYSTVAYAAGIINNKQVNYYNSLISSCQDQINNNVLDSPECDNVMGQLSNDSGAPGTTFVNVYDIRLYDPTGGSAWPLPGVDYEADYLNNPIVREAIHASLVPHPWAECNDTVNSVVFGQDASSLYLFPDLLARIRVLLYNGQFDLICNHVGTTEYLDVLEWSGAAEWKAANSSVWTAPKDGFTQTAGYTRSSQNLTYLLVLGGSHMVPMDQPEFTFDMIRRFISNETYADAPQSVGTEDNSSSKSLTEKMWIGIIIGCFIGGVFIGALFIRDQLPFSQPIEYSTTATTTSHNNQSSLLLLLYQQHQQQQ